MIKPFVLRGVGVLLLAVVFSGCNRSELSPPLPIQPQSSASPIPTTSSQANDVRQIADNTLPLREYWRVTFEYIGGGNPPSLQAMAGYVIYYTAGQGVYGQLRVLETKSGALVWEQIQFDGAESLAVDHERVYLAIRQKLYTYALDDGELLWEQPLPSNVGRMYVDGERLKMSGYVERQPAFLEFNIHTGEPLGNMAEIRPDGRLIALYPSFILLQLPDYQLRAVDKDTQQVLWTTDLGRGPIIPRPLVLDDLLLVAHGSQVCVLDLLTGQIKWQTEGNFAASNIVFANESVYALDYHTRLVRLDVHTGQETGYVQFLPADITASGVRYAEDFHWVAVDGAMVFVAFGDHELIALGP